MSCAARRRVAARMAEEGNELPEIATALRVSEYRVLRLLEALEDRDGLDEHRSDQAPTAVVRELFTIWQATDSDARNVGKLANLAGYDSIAHVQRLLGLIPNTDVVKHGNLYRGQLRDRISTENAGRLVRAMGYLPAEVHGL
jgi:hypothetical protein